MTSPHRLAKVTFLLLGVIMLLPVRSQSLLWEIGGNGLRKPSYLFGTIHAACPDDLSAGDSLTFALESSTRLILEIDITDPGIALTMMNGMLMKEGVTLKDLLPETDYQKLDQYFRDSINLNLTMFDRIKPMLLSGFMFSHILNCETISVEGWLTEIAQKNSLKIDGLETPKEQLDIFDSIPYTQQAEKVLELIETPQQQTDYNLLQDLYKRGQIEQIYEYSMKSRLDLHSFEKLLLTDRNRKWVKKIPGLIQEDAAFIAVGAAHLGGPQGLITLLRKEGYLVRPVSLL